MSELKIVDFVFILFFSYFIFLFKKLKLEFNMIL